MKKVYLDTKINAKPSSWSETIHKILNSYGLPHLWENPELLFNLEGRGNLEAKSIEAHKSFWKKYISKIILQHEEKLWFKRMSTKKEHNKLRNFITFKKTLKMEKYLSASNNPNGRIYHTSLRNGTNVLEIERGRWKHIPMEYRYCTLCDLKKVEDEKHFLLTCPLYNDLREKFYQNVSNVSNRKWDLKCRSPDESFILLMQGTGDDYEQTIFRIFHCHLERCFKLRNKLKSGG